MTVHRKSNWYIYFIAFGVTIAFAVMAMFTFRWFLFPEESETVGINASGELDENFVPDASYSFSLISMISDEMSGMPRLFLLVEYNAVDSRLTLVPIPNGITVASDGRTLPNVYAATGGQGVAEKLSSILGIDCDRYIHFDRASFTDIVTSFGNVQYNVPQTLLINDGGEVDTINAGTQLFSGNRVYRYIMLAEFPDGESYRFNMVGDLLAELFNQNSSYLDSSLLDTYTSSIIEQTETNITLEDLTKYKPALLNTSKYVANPAEYYVPYGEYGEDESFNISENSITTIHQKAGLDK